MAGRKAITRPELVDDKTATVLAERAEAIVAGVDIAPTVGFQRARRVLREALKAKGLLDEIDTAVKSVLAGAIAGESGKELT
jgi:hypothetical protein